MRVCVCVRVYTCVSVRVYIGVHAFVRPNVRACGVCTSLWAIQVSHFSRINMQQTRHVNEYVNIVSDMLLYFVCFVSVAGVRDKRGNVQL